MGVFGPRPVGLVRSLRAPRGARPRSLTPDPDSWQVSPAKKARLGQDEQATPPSSPLSAEQLVRIQRNKAAALLRLAARNVPAGFGESWRQQLGGEFGKPYFGKVSSAGPACVRGCLLFRPPSSPLPFRAELNGAARCLGGSEDWRPTVPRLRSVVGRRSQDSLSRGPGDCTLVGGLGASCLPGFLDFAPGNPGGWHHRADGMK